jgi:hypothetical protein
MTLNLALVISGDPAGAKNALADTGTGIENLSKKTDQLNKKAGETTNVWGNVSKSTGEAATNIGKASEATGGLASGLGEVAAGGAKAAPEIEKAGTAASNAGGGFSVLSGSLGKIALSFGAGLGIGLITQGFDLAAGKAAEFVRGILSDQPRIEQDLKSHATLIRDIKAAYAEADGAASSYGNNSRELLEFRNKENQKRLKRDYDDSLPEAGALVKRTNPKQALPDTGPFTDVIAKYRKELQEGKADVIAFRTEVATIASALPDDSRFRQVAQGIISQTEKAAELQEELSRAQGLAKGLAGDADAAATALGGRGVRQFRGNSGQHHRDRHGGSGCYPQTARI